MSKLKIEYIPNEVEEDMFEKDCLITQLMQFITIIGLREIEKETSCNNEKGVGYEQAA